MTNVKYNIRQKLNELVREKGNKIIRNLGDVLAEDDNEILGDIRNQFVLGMSLVVPIGTICLANIQGITYQPAYDIILAIQAGLVGAGLAYATKIYREKDKRKAWVEEDKREHPENYRIEGLGRAYAADILDKAFPGKNAREKFLRKLEEERK